MPPANLTLDPPTGRPLPSANSSRPPGPAGPSLHDFLAELLLEQQRLQTPVAQIAALHDFSPSTLQSFSHSHPSRLIPLSAPRPGEQYAFEVDLDACTGCKACVVACHSLNGLDDTEAWRDTGLLVSDTPGESCAQTITTACHHCADPGCLNGCPVLAYEKDPVTGIVRHLDDQCIGCQYCVLKCPYDVPKYNARLGIVRKCDLCHQRLAHGEAPACAQACPTQAIRVVTVSRHDRWAPAPQDSRSQTTSAINTPTVAAEDGGNHRLRPISGPSSIPFELRSLNSDLRSSATELRSPVSELRTLPFPGPDPTYTRPTTRYVTRRKFPTHLRAADAATLRPQPPHWPLIVMLTLLPWAITLQAVTSFQNLTSGAKGSVNHYVALSHHLAPLVLGALGLAAATFHLGQPLRAWRVFLGWRRSWFSREAMLFGAWFGGTAITTIAPWLPAPIATFVGPSAFQSFTLSLLGFAGLVCSVMIYVDTRRAFWRPTQTAPRFLLGGLVLALACVAPALAAVAGGTKLAIEFASLAGSTTSARLQQQVFRRLVFARCLLALFGFAALLSLPVAGAANVAYYAQWAAGVTLLFAGELAERYLFFRAVDAPKMPGYATR